MPQKDTNYRQSERLKMAASAARERGDIVGANGLSDAAVSAHWQECLADYDQAKAKANTPLIEVWGGRSLERGR